MLAHRLLDASFVTKKGGMITEGNSPTLWSYHYIANRGEARSMVNKLPKKLILIVVKTFN